MNFKKFLLIMFICFLPFMLIACDKDSDPDPNSDPDPVHATEPYPIGLSVEVSKKEYAKNEEFDGTITKAEAIYSDNTVKNVSGLIALDNTRFDKTKDGLYEIIVSFQENLNDTTYLVKWFYLAKVGTGIGTGGGTGGEGGQVFGPGTYTFDGSMDLKTYNVNDPINPETKFANGYFVMKGSGSKRANATAYAIELVKAEGSWIEFVVNGYATVSVVCSSTGGENTSAIAIFDSESQLVQNNELITTITGTSQRTLTYILTTGTYRILSQANTSFSTRGVRIYKVVVTQG